jgi:rubrerythrin
MGEDLALTTSAIMSRVERLEDDSAAFYEKLASRFEEGRQAFQEFAEESGKNKTHLLRTYQETISDALEATFSFQGLDLSGLEVALPEEVSLKEALKIALRLEKRASSFYTQIAEQSQSLLATIPRAFSRVARKREARIEVLQEMLERA